MRGETKPVYLFDFQQAAPQVDMGTLLHMLMRLAHAYASPSREGGEGKMPVETGGMEKVAPRASEGPSRGPSAVTTHTQVPSQTPAGVSTGRPTAVLTSPGPSITGAPSRVEASPAAEGPVNTRVVTESSHRLGGGKGVPVPKGPKMR